MQEPLAFRMRPQKIEEIIGQKHLIGEGNVLRKCLAAKRIFRSEERRVGKEC